MKPLWQRLNEERTQGEWWEEYDNDQFHQFYNLFVGDGSNALIYPYNSLNEGEYKANAQYTALAVNNLASLAEAITGQMEDVSSKEFYELMQSYRLSPANDQEAVIKAFIAVKNFITRRTKESLNKIS